MNVSERLKPSYIPKKSKPSSQRELKCSLNALYTTPVAQKIKTERGLKV